jgi:hypothetical protein
VKKEDNSFFWEEIKKDLSDIEGSLLKMDELALDLCFLLLKKTTMQEKQLLINLIHFSGEHRRNIECLSIKLASKLNQ